MEVVKQRTQTWIQEVVVMHGFCPFAAREVERGSIAYHVCKGKDRKVFLEKLIACCQEMDLKPEIETSFLIFETALSDFEDYLDMTALANALLELQDYEGVYQLASFHPEYRFEEEETAADFTNRSPYPMWHLLREESVTTAVEMHPDAAAIPERNIQLAQKKGIFYFESILKKIKSQS